MQFNKKEIKHLAGLIKKEENTVKVNSEYENSLKSVEKILKKKKRRK
jgi:ABC-type hemin transport system substrate-binding protein